MDTRRVGEQMAEQAVEWAADGYTEIKVLGSGATGRVVLARAEADGALVALKYLAAHLVGDESFVTRLRQEAALMAHVRDPHVVRLHGVLSSPDGTGIALVMEAVEGPSLRMLLDRWHGSPQAALALLRGSLLGLAAAHDRGVVHRDYKPENVLVDAAGESKLTDFGIAAWAGADAPAEGTPQYMPPEQWSGQAATFASDMYAASVTFYECLVGRRPFRADTLAGLRSLHESAPVPLDDVPAPVRGLVARGLAKDPAHRYEDVRRFIADVEATATAGYGAGWLEAGLATLAAVSGVMVAALPALALGAAGGAAVGGGAAGAVGALGAGGGAAGAGTAAAAAHAAGSAAGQMAATAAGQAGVAAAQAGAAAHSVVAQAAAQASQQAGQHAASQAVQPALQQAAQHASQQAAQHASQQAAQHASQQAAQHAAHQAGQQAAHHVSHQVSHHVGQQTARQGSRLARHGAKLLHGKALAATVATVVVAGGTTAAVVASSSSGDGDGRVLNVDVAKVMTIDDAASFLNIPVADLESPMRMPTLDEDHLTMASSLWTVKPDSSQPYASVSVQVTVVHPGGSGSVAKRAANSYKGDIANQKRLLSGFEKTPVTPFAPLTLAGADQAEAAVSRSDSLGEQFMNGNLVFQDGNVIVEVSYSQEGGTADQCSAETQRLAEYVLARLPK